MHGSDKDNPWGAAAKPHAVHADTIFRAGERHGTAPGIGTIERTFSAASARSESRGPAGSSAEARDPGSPRRIAPATRGRTLPTRASVASAQAHEARERRPASIIVAVTDSGVR